MATAYTYKDSNIAKTWALMTGFFVVVIGIGWVFAQAYGNSLILYIAIAFSLVMNFVSYWYSDKIVLSLAHARPIEHSENPELYHLVENLAITAGLPMPKLYIIDDPAPNAFATGRNAEHAVVAVTSGLVAMLDKNEMEGVLAHELSHIGNRDILLSTVVVVLVGFISILSNIFLRSTFFGFGRRSNDREGGNILMIVGIVLAIFAPISLTLVQLAISRRREMLADASGALLTRYPEGLASALEKIGSYSGPAQAVPPAMAHLYIANPFTGKKISNLFSTHPPIEERVAALRGME
jgi:heat shock protein HtpX